MVFLKMRWGLVLVQVVISPLSVGYSPNRYENHKIAPRLSAELDADLTSKWAQLLRMESARVKNGYGLCTSTLSASVIGQFDGSSEKRYIQRLTDAHTRISVKAHVVNREPTDIMAR